MSKREWWYPQTKAEMAKELRELYSEHKELLDQEILDQFDISDSKYATTWDNLGDAQEQFEKVADRLLEQEKEIERLRELLKESLTYVLYAEHDIGPWDQTEQPFSAKIAKEVHDER